MVKWTNVEERYKHMRNPESQVFAAVYLGALQSLTPPPSSTGSQLGHLPWVLPWRAEPEGLADGGRERILCFVMGMYACQTGEGRERTEGGERERESWLWVGKNTSVCLMSYKQEQSSERHCFYNLHLRSLSQGSGRASRITHSKDTAAPYRDPSQPSISIHHHLWHSVPWRPRARCWSRCETPARPCVQWSGNRTFLDSDNSYLSLYKLSYFLNAWYRHLPLLCMDPLGRVHTAACPKHCS